MDLLFACKFMDLHAGTFWNNLEPWQTLGKEEFQVDHTQKYIGLVELRLRS